MGGVGWHMVGESSAILYFQGLLVREGNRRWKGQLGRAEFVKATGGGKGREGKKALMV